MTHFASQYLNAKLTEWSYEKYAHYLKGFVERVCPHSPLIKHVAQRRHFNTNTYLD